VPEKRIINTSPLVFLARAGLLEMLRAGDHETVVPEPVIAEIQGHGDDDPTVKAIREVDWLILLPGPVVPSEIAAWELGPGESAVLALALAETGARVVIDDRDARRCARSLAIPVIGTLGLVLLAKETGRIEAARPVVERLRETGMYLADRVVNEALARVGE
jgi:predicted nucleic acid-binding protein